MKNKIRIITALFTGILVISACAGHKDCQGHRHKGKTEMGGYL